ncbi:MAG: hypothetical protein L6R40_005250 [Gallowayella cf. fulva]|nr:MAG: hypothetical protein L6R40_005250 [Xanthomendoza cf. fulva]
MASAQPFRILDLPLELRFEILSYLLPSQSDISTPVSWDERYGWDTWDPKDPTPCPGILLVNRQLYHEGISCLYAINSFHVTVTPTRCSFLNDENLVIYWLHRQPRFRYDAMKEFVIKIQSGDIPWTVDNLRNELIRLCRCFHFNNVHFRKLRIEFPEPLGPLREDYWGMTWEHTWSDAWDAAEPKDWDLVPDVFEDDEGGFVTHHETAAYRKGTPSTFAWILCVFATLPALADQCIIKVPDSLQDKTHMLEIAQHYEKVLDGRVEISEKEEWCLKADAFDIGGLFLVSPQVAPSSLAGVGMGQAGTLFVLGDLLYGVPISAGGQGWWTNVCEYPRCFWGSWMKQDEEWGDWKDDFVERLRGHWVDEFPHLTLFAKVGIVVVGLGSTLWEKVFGSRKSQEDELGW